MRSKRKLLWLFSDVLLYAVFLLSRIQIPLQKYSIFLVAYCPNYICSTFQAKAILFLKIVNFTKTVSLLLCIFLFFWYQW